MSPGIVKKSLLWAGTVAAAVPCFYLCFVLIGVWRDPLAWDDGNWVRFGVGLMLLEFVLIHSGTFLGAFLVTKAVKLKQRLQIIAVLMVFYSVLVLGTALSLDSMELLVIFGTVSLGRIAILFDDSEQSGQLLLARSAVGMILYLLVVMASIFLPLPQWGLSGEVLNQVYPDRGSGVWEQEPQRALAGAAIYFFCMGLVELFLLNPLATHTHNKQVTDSE
ncbi:MAG: hypothetical protein RL120_18785 [Gammaproteobacteria bacterium]